MNGRGQCEVGEGDCAVDEDCVPPAICGTENCRTDFNKGREQGKGDKTGPEQRDRQKQDYLRH